MAATASFAQSALQIVGNFDAGYKSVSNNMNPTAKLSTIGSNNSSTSLFIFKGTEDLGGGMKASFLAEIDHGVVNSSTANQGQASAGQAWTGTPFNGEQYAGLSGDFGDIKLGTPNSPGLIAGITAQPFGTALGGGYSGGFGRLGTATVSGVNQFVGNTTGRIIRHEKTAVYTTPNFNGFTAQVEYSAKNSNSGTYTSDNNGYQGFAANYNNGPLNAMFYTATATAGTVQAAGIANAGDAPTANALAAGANVKWNILAANYTLGATTLYAGVTSTKASDLSEDSKSWNVAAKYALNPKVDLMANYLQRKSNLASQNDATHTPNANLLGLGADYKLSKLTALYVRYEHITGLNVAAVAANNGVAAVNAAGGATQNTTSVGLRVSF